MPVKQRNSFGSRTLGQRRISGRVSSAGAGAKRPFRDSKAKTSFTNWNSKSKVVSSSGTSSRHLLCPKSVNMTPITYLGCCLTIFLPLLLMCPPYSLKHWARNLEENICAETHDWIMDSSQGGNVLLTQECFIHWHFYEPNCSSFIFKTILKIYPINLQICIFYLGH